MIIPTLFAVTVLGNPLKQFNVNCKATRSPVEAAFKPRTPPYYYERNILTQIISAKLSPIDAAVT